MSYPLKAKFTLDISRTRYFQILYISKINSVQFFERLLISDYKIINIEEILNLRFKIYSYNCLLLNFLFVTILYNAVCQHNTYLD